MERARAWSIGWVRYYHHCCSFPDWKWLGIESRVVQMVCVLMTWWLVLKDAWVLVQGLFYLITVLSAFSVFHGRWWLCFYVFPLQTITNKTGATVLANNEHLIRAVQVVLLFSAFPLLFWGSHKRYGVASFIVCKISDLCSQLGVDSPKWISAFPTGFLVDNMPGEAWVLMWPTHRLLLQPGIWKMTSGYLHRALHWPQLVISAFAKSSVLRVRINYIFPIF